MANINLQRVGTQTFETYINDEGSERWIGISSIDLPEFSFKAIDMAGAGILGDISFPVPGMTENLETTLHLRTLQPEIFKMGSKDAHDLTLRSAQTTYDSALGKTQVEKTKINFRGMANKVANGKFEVASETESEITFALMYIKITINDKDCLELDKMNSIYKVNGVDQLVAMREAVGL